MAERRFVLRHEVLGAGSTETSWTKDFETFEEAQKAADEEWWTADARAVRQTIQDSANGKEVVRRQDATWMTVQGKRSHFRR
jgi:hypothetical protein